MKLSNQRKDAEREKLANDVANWITKGNAIPLVPIRFGADYKSFFVLNHAENKKSHVTYSEKRATGMRMLQEGRTYRDVAQKLGVHPKTVATWAKDWKRKNAT